MIMFENDLKSQLNEILPLLYVCLKLALAQDKETNLETLHLITDLDEFLASDPKQELLNIRHLPAILKPAEMLARLYVLDSHTYPEEAEYWLNYNFKLI